MDDRHTPRPVLATGRRLAGAAAVVSLLALFLPSAVESLTGPGASPGRAASETLWSSMAGAQATWRARLAHEGIAYRSARLVVFHDAVPRTSGCFAEVASEPFYCPQDETIYVGVAFERELARRLGEASLPALAYVLAHETGHHVQHVLARDEDLFRRMAATPSRGRELARRFELEADCLAGVWFHDGPGASAKPRDVMGALRVADELASWRVPERHATGAGDAQAWSHGSPGERMEWFLRGYLDGDPRRCIDGS